MTLVYRLSEDYTLAKTVGYLTKGEAEKITGVCGGEILDLDDVYGGFLVRNRYIFISESAAVRGIKRYGSDLINGLLDERTETQRAEADA